MTINVALLGAGRMGMIHYENLLKIPDVKVNYIYDPNIQQDISVSNLTTVLEDPKVEACIIATPSSTHMELVKLCAEHGKHIFCEKPISFNIQILENLKNIIHKNNIKLQVGFNRRFDPSFEKISKLVALGAIGKVQLIKITNRDPKRPDLNFVKDSGGLFFDFNIHDFDTLRFISGLEITEVYAVGDALIQPELKQFNDIDTALISLKLSNNALAIIDCSRETGYGYDQRLEIFGERGMLSLPNLTTTSVVSMSKTGAQSQRIPFSFVERYKNSYFNELSSFIQCLQQNFSPAPNIDDAIKAVRVATAAQKSFEKNSTQSMT